MPKVILITGASSGLGLAIAEYLASQGYVVYGSSRSIKTEGKRFKTLVMDVCNRGSVDVAVRRIISEQGRIDVLINNAGLGITGPLEHLQESDVLNVFNTNILGVLRVSQAVLPYMRDQRSGLIINISSIGSEMGLPYRGPYSASKAAVDRITEAMRIEVKNFGVQVCTVQPGGINTEIINHRVTSAMPSDSVYKDTYDRAYTIVNESVRGGLAAESFGPVIGKIIQSKKVRRNYRIGKPAEKLSVLIKRILPGNLFEKVISGHYKI